MTTRTTTTATKNTTTTQAQGGSAALPSLTLELDQLVAREGVGQAKLHTLSLLARYFGDKGDPEEDRLSQVAAHAAALAEENATLRQALEAARCGKPDGASLALGQAYVARLRREAALAQAPLGDAELAQVETLLRQGHVDAAHVVGDVLLEKSRAEGQVKFRQAQAVSLEEAPPDPQAVETAAKARLLRHRGYQVDLSQDGTRIERAVAPKKGAARAR